VLGAVQVVPPQGLAALRGLHLDSACAPAVTWQLEEAGQKQDQLNQSVHASRGTPSCPGEPWPWALACHLLAARLSRGNATWRRLIMLTDVPAHSRSAPVSPAG